MHFKLFNEILPRRPHHYPVTCGHVGHIFGRRDTVDHTHANTRSALNTLLPPLLEQNRLIGVPTLLVTLNIISIQLLCETLLMT